MGAPGHRVVAIGFICAAFFAGGQLAYATAPEGPRLAFVRLAERPPTLQLMTSDPSGLDQQVIAGGGKRAQPLPLVFSAPSWSPDGSQVVFAGFHRKASAGKRVGVAIYVANADGSGLGEIPGTAGGIDPVVSSDGRQIAFGRERRVPHGSARGRSGIEISVWLVAPDGAGLRRLTAWAKRTVSLPTSFSPDGSLLAFDRTVGERPAESIALRLDGSGSTVLVRDGGGAVYSPDGARVAFLRSHTRTFKRRGGRGEETITDLFVMNADGSGSRRLTSTPNVIELWPSWDPSGQRLAYAQLRAGASAGDFLGLGDSIEEINADGTCGKTVLASPQLALYGPAWQPGAGREAGPLTC